jgi:hypothetical protein
MAQPDDASSKTRGGKTIHGAAVGILMLDTRFPRIPGDIGNALTWPFPVLYRVVRGASPDRVVRHGAAGLLDDFIAAARALVADGADGITTNCGFLALFQAPLAAALAVPVASSALLQVAPVQRLLPPGKRVGIITISAATMTEAHLAAAGVAPDTPVVGTEGGCEFSRAILDDEPEMDFVLAGRDLNQAAMRLVDTNDDIGAIVLECTNMVPYAADIRRATGLPVFSIYSLIQWFQAGLMPRRFAGGLDDPR